MNRNILVSVIVLAIIINPFPVYALGMTAGTVKILVNVGSSGSSRFGLVNNGNETIIVSIRAEGDAAQFIEFPSELEIAPKETSYVDVKAAIPSTYDGSLGGEIEGYIYAVQEGEPGQVQINVQAKKKIQIFIPEYGGELPETQIESDVVSSDKGDMITGFVSLIEANSLALSVIGVGVLIFFAYVISRRFGISIKSKRR